MLVIQLERRCYRRIQDFELFTKHFNPAGNKIVIDSPFRTRTDGTRHPETIFVTDRFGDPEYFGPVRITDDLNQSFTIPHVDKYDPAVIPPPVHPAAQCYSLTD